LIVVGLLVGGCLFAVLLLVLLWSTRAQRYTRVTAGAVEHLEDFRGTFEGLLQSWTCGQNSVRLHENRSLFEALLDAISRAEHSVHLECYVWGQGEICERFAATLSSRAREGVEVRLLVDAMGAWTRSTSLFDGMREAGVEIQIYHDFRFRTLGRLNKRDHRKLLVCDGREAFVFGHGIAQEWDGDGDAPQSWRDLGAHIEGPAVTRLQAIFAQNWMEERGVPLIDPRYFASAPTQGGVEMQVVASSPRGGVSNSSLLYRTLVAWASKRLIIANPYFVPGQDVVDLLVQAAQRGVDIRLLVPGPHTDLRLVQWAGHKVYQQLLEAGVSIFEFQPTLNHQKVMVVDDTCAYLGSANFDERSFDINAELGVVFWDDELCHSLVQIFETDLEKARPIQLDQWLKRGPLRRIRERAAFLVHQQL
jgi:cardiolipin synthase